MRAQVSKFLLKNPKIPLHKRQEAVPIKIGIVSIQGDVEEHVVMVKKALEELGMKGDVLLVRNSDHLQQADALIIPGGESTTISKLMVRFKLMAAIRKRVTLDDLPVLGTCAGCILIAKLGDEDVMRTKTKLIGLMDMEVSRNSYGRQVDSFEAHIKFNAKNKLVDFKDPFPAVFIRAPSITKVNEDCKPIARYKDEIIAAQQGRRLALTFHPELTGDTRIHKYFIKLAGK